MAKKKQRRVRRPSIGTTRQRSREFNPDYSYIKQDLRRIAVLAGSFVIFLVVLSFFLN